MNAQTPTAAARTRLILEDLEAVRENLLALSDLSRRCKSTSAKTATREEVTNAPLKHPGRCSISGGRTPGVRESGLVGSRKLRRLGRVKGGDSDGS